MLSSIAIAFEVCECHRSAQETQGSSFDLFKALHTFAQLQNTKLTPFLSSTNGWFHFFMLVENVSPAADQPESWAVGQLLTPVVTTRCRLDPWWFRHLRHRLNPNCQLDSQPRLQLRVTSVPHGSQRDALKIQLCNPSLPFNSSRYKLKIQKTTEECPPSNTAGAPPFQRVQSVAKMHTICGIQELPFLTRTMSVYEYNDQPRHLCCRWPPLMAPGKPKTRTKTFRQSCSAGSDMITNWNSTSGQISRGKDESMLGHWYPPSQAMAEPCPRKRAYKTCAHA
eukprot:1137032-Pelagomonas_calceolata.AAC.1